MIEHFDLSLVNWSRAQFAMTALYHWFFIPITIGLTYIIAIMNTIYVRTNSEEWKRITKFWMTLFGINFAIGVATGIIMEFEFGTNWSYYSWFVGDIFGAPLAIEGILAFFLESTFIAVMFFGWDKVSKKFHLLSTWLVAFGASLSALWILVANAWMQYPVGMTFNLNAARNEMMNFWDVLFSPVAINKFLHTIASGFVISSLFVIAVSSWYLLKNRELYLAKKSMVVAAVFGLITSLFLAFTGDGSAYWVAQKQPVKLAAMEGLYDGKQEAGLIAFGILNHQKQIGDTQKSFIFKIEIPKLLSILAHRSADAFVPGVNDFVYGNLKQGIDPASVRIDKGKIALAALADYKRAVKAGNEELATASETIFRAQYFQMGYGYFNNPKDIIPNVPMIFYSFHIMVWLGFYFIGLFIIILFLLFRDKIQNHKWLLWMGLLSIPLGYIASQTGWIVSEVGRQPWIIQDLMPTKVAASSLQTTSVMITFWLFVALFTALLVAEIKIMITQIKSGPETKKGGSNV